VDLAVVDVRLVNAVGTDPRNGLPEAPRELRVRYVVRNRGSTESAERWVRGTLIVPSMPDSALLPPLVPGDSAFGELELVVTAPWLAYSEYEDWSKGTTQRALVRLVQPGALRDADAENDTARTTPFMLVVPALELSVGAVAVPRVRVNEPFPLRFALHNRSRHETLAGVQLAICMWDEDLDCAPRWGRTHTAGFDAPVLAPGDSLAEERMVAIGPTAVWQDEAWRYGLSLCAFSADWTDPYTPPYAEIECAFASALRVRPDYQGACSPPLLHAGETATLPAHNCGLLPPTTQSHGDDGPGWYNEGLLDYRFHLVAAELVADQDHVLADAGGAITPHYLLDAEGERAGTLSGSVFRVPTSGRYYLVLYDRAPALEVTLTTP
jgi:hypothetical protein